MSVSFDPKILGALAGLQLKARYVMEGFVAGVHGSPFRGPSVEFAEYRDYQPGDDPHDIDWRLYARNDRLCVKQYEKETNARCYVLCDTSASMAYRGSRAWGSKMDCARVLATALSWLLLRQNDAVGSLSLDLDERVRYVAPSRKPNRFGEMLGHFETLRPGGGLRLEALLAHAARLFHRRSLVLVLSDLLEPWQPLERAFRRLRFDGHECVVLQVMDPDEVDFPFVDGTVLEDLETVERRQSRPGTREAYLARFEAFMAAYRDLFHRLAIQHCRVRTDEHPGTVLARFLEGRKRLR